MSLEVSQICDILNYVLMKNFRVVNKEYAFYTYGHVKIDVFNGDTR